MEIGILLLAAFLMPFGATAGEQAQSVQNERPTAPVSIGAEQHIPKQSARITVDVEDQSGAVIPNAQVRCLDSSGVLLHEAHTDANGRTTLTTEPGSYDIAVTSSGFGTWHRGLEVEDGESRTISFALSVSQVTQIWDPETVIPAFSVSLWIPNGKSTVEVGKKIRLTVTTGILRAAATFMESTGGAEQDYAVDVRRADDERPLGQLHLEMIGGAGRAAPATVAPGRHRPWISVHARVMDKFVEELNLSALYDLTQPGTYTVQVSHLDENNVRVTSVPVRFTVVPSKAADPTPASE